MKILFTLLIMSMHFFVNAQLPSLFGFAKPHLNANNTNTPQPPLLLQNDSNNTITAKHDLFSSDIVYSRDGQNFFPYIEPVQVGDVQRLNGYIKFKLKSTLQHAESSLVLSGPFSISGTNYSPKKIVILGSSTSVGSGAVPITNSYVNLLTSHLKELNNTVSVINLAAGGYSTYSILPTNAPAYYGRVLPDTNRNISAALKYYPDAIIINLPSNDATALYPIDESNANFNWVIAEAANANVPVWITTTQPRHNSNTNQYLTLLADGRDSIFSAMRTQVIDFWTGLNVAGFTTIRDEYNADDIHLNNAGHSLLFNRVMASTFINTVFKMQVIPDRKPVVFNLRVNGQLKVGNTLTLSYQFKDPEGTPEGATTYQWIRGNDLNNSNHFPINGATGLSYTLTNADINKYIYCRITPITTTSQPGMPIKTFNFYANTISQ